MSVGPLPPTTPPVTFNYTAWLVAYPEFGNVLMGQAQGFFNSACILLDNTPTTPIVDTFNNGSPLYPWQTLTGILNAATAHFAYLFTPDSSGNVRPVGRISQAAEGTVSLALEYVTPSSATEAWWNQTAFGAYVWTATLIYRSFRFSPQPCAPGFPGFFPGRSRGFC